MFDLGGVLADLGNPATLMDLGLSEEEFWSLWIASEAVHAFETGKMNEARFLQELSTEMQLEEPADHFRQRFLRWHLKLFPFAVNHIRALKPHYEIALLSNTNSIHWAMIESQAPARDLFDYIFLSFETGHSKPHDAAFEHVLNHVSVSPAQILFLDDSVRNIEAARKLGMSAEQVHGSMGMTNMLLKAGIGR